MKRIAAVLLGLCLLTGCAGAQDEDMNIMVEDDVQEVAYTLIDVKRGDITSEVSIRCQYMPKEKITCAFEGQEREITEILVEKGDFVTKGDVLARQDVEEFEELIKKEISIAMQPWPTKSREWISEPFSAQNEAPARQEQASLR